MFGRSGNSLIELIRSQREEARHEHEETMSYLQRQDEESKRRAEEWREETKQREEESKQRDEQFRRREGEMREFNREILLRNEKVYTAVIAQLEKNTARMDSGIEETKAQTQALLRLIDRFDSPGGAAAA